jgi:hypothetical protein
MFPGPRRRSGAPRALAPRAVRASSSLAAIAFGAVLLLAGCGASFDPTGPCTTDGKIAGAYPDMEAVVPKSYQGAPPKQLDSGRTCSSQGLGSLASHGVKELRFAGATWETGTQSGLTLATFSSAGGPALDPAWLSEFYESTARTAKNIQTIETRAVQVAPGVTAQRLDVLNDESYQTVIVWDAGGRVSAVLVGDFIREVPTKEAHEAIVEAALAAQLGASAAG